MLLNTEKFAQLHGPQVPEQWLQDKRINSVLTGKKFTPKNDFVTLLFDVFYLIKSTKNDLTIIP